ncbi:MAG: 50S ribosome-binding GTPase, partial [Holosporales bacterium]|nr:50S ribosome-binding GTPase [Holosporales bacterium]
METSARLDKFKIVIVGKANVGKSTLFNRLVGRREAIVFDRPGVTRDLRDREIVFMGKQACIVDTPGLLDTLSFKDHPDLRRIIASELGNAIQEASLLLFLLDGASGITVIDRDVAELIRKSGKQVMVLVNKSDRSEADSVYDEALEFGFERTM